MKPKMLEGRRYRGGGPPYITIGKLVRYRLSDVEEFLAVNRRTQTPHVPGCLGRKLASAVHTKKPPSQLDGRKGGLEGTT